VAREEHQLPCDDPLDYVLEVLGVELDELLEVLHLLEQLYDLLMELVDFKCRLEYALDGHVKLHNPLELLLRVCDLVPRPPIREVVVS
jgi:hypothetical protein